MPRRANGTPTAASTIPRPALPTVLSSSGQAPTSKATACYTALFKCTEKPAPYDAESPERFYFDLFLLSPDKVVLRKLCSEISDAELLDKQELRVRQSWDPCRPASILTRLRPQDNIRELFHYSVQCLKGGEDETDRVLHVLIVR